MKRRQNWLLIAAVVLLTALPLWLVPTGSPGTTFGGADGQAQQVIGDIAPNYQPWFTPLLEPASSEIASLLFALQAAIGAGVIGFWLGAAVTRDRLKKEAERKMAEATQDRRVD